MFSRLFPGMRRRSAIPQLRRNYGGDTTPPTVTAFVVPATSTSLTIPITEFTATDDVGVTGYLVTETGDVPALDDPGWSGSAPATYTVASVGAKTLYAWAKDAAGNISAAATAVCTVSFVDSFTGSGAMAAPWLNTAWTEAGGAAVAAIALGAELVVNGDFSAWTGDNPDGWTVSGESGSDPMVTEVAGPAARMYSSATNYVPLIQQLNILSSQWLSYSVTISISSGNLYLYGFNNDAYLATGTTAKIALPGGEDDIKLRLQSPPGDIVISSVSAKHVSLPTALQLVNAGRANLTASVTPATFAANTQLGSAICWDSDTTPLNGVIGFFDRTNNHAKLLKCVAGTWTTLVDVAVTYSAGAVVKVVQTGDTTFQLWYGGTQRGTDVTISDAGITGNTLCGLFTTYTGNTFADVTIEVS